MHIQSILKEIGLSENEARIYEALLEVKKATVSQIAQKAKINRTSAYDILEYLHQKGLVLKFVENKKISFKIENPKRLYSWLLEEDREVEKRKTLFQKNFSTLGYFFKATPSAPKIEYFEGYKRLNDFFEDSLQYENSETVGYASHILLINRAREKFISYYAKMRLKKNITGRFIVSEAEEKNAKLYLSTYYKTYLLKNPNLLRIKLLPTKEKEIFLHETNIYKNRISISHMSENFFGIIIEDKDVASTQRIVFDTLWRILKKEVRVT